MLAYNFGYLWNVARSLLDEAGFSHSPSDESIGNFIQKAKNLASLMRGSKATLNMYLNSTGNRVVYEPDDFEGFITGDASQGDIISFAEDIIGISSVATDWWGMHHLTGSDLEETPTIRIHNHPTGVPSPPSAIRDTQGHLSGDITLPGFFGGVISGLVLDTDRGEELFFLYEEDRSNAGAYIDMFRKFWKSRQDITGDLRQIAMQAYQGTKPSSAGLDLQYSDQDAVAGVLPNFQAVPVVRHSVNMSDIDSAA
jgi:hypothetical protein